MSYFEIAISKRLTKWLTEQAEALKERVMLGHCDGDSYRELVGRYGAIVETLAELKNIEKDINEGK